MTVTGLNLRTSVDRCEGVDYIPTAVINAGEVLSLAGLLCLSAETFSATDVAALKLGHFIYDAPGVQLNALTAGAWATGVPLYWDNANLHVTDIAANGVFCGYSLQAKVATTQTDCLIRWLGMGAGGDLPVAIAKEDIVFKEDFIIQAIADLPAWTVVDVGDATIDIEANVNGGVMKGLIAATDEAEDASMYYGDQLLWDIDSLKSMVFRAKVITPGTGVCIVMGMAGAHNLDKDTIAQSAWFRCQASLVLLAETDDGTNDNDDGATGVTLTTNVYYWFKIDFSDPADIRFLYKADTADAWTDLTPALLVAEGITAFDMSNYTAGLQPYFSGDKASGTGTGAFHVDVLEIRSGRA